MIRTIGVGAFAILALTTCTHGVNVTHFKPANSPSGAMVYFRITGSAVSWPAELYAVDSAWVMLKDGELRRIAWTRLLRFDVQGLGSNWDVRSGTHPDTAKVERLRLISRFPQGLDETLLADVLANLRLKAVTEIR